MWPNPQFSVDLVTFTEEILNGKLHFLRSENKSENKYSSIKYYGRIFFHGISNGVILSTTIQFVD